MPIIRLQAPEGVTSFSHQGHAEPIGRDGIVEIDDRHAADYAIHGFTPAGAPRATAQSLAADRIFAADPRPDAREVPPAAAPVVVRDADPARAAIFDRLAALPQTSLDRLVAALEAGSAPAPVVAPSPAAEPQLSPVPPMVEEQAPSGRLTDEQVDAMTKAQCIAWCKANDVPAVPPIDVDVLRAKIKAKQG